MCNRIQLIIKIKYKSRGRGHKKLDPRIFHESSPPYSIQYSICDICNPLSKMLTSFYFWFSIHPFIRILSLKNHSTVLYKSARKNPCHAFVGKTLENKKKTTFNLFKDFKGPCLNILRNRCCTPCPTAGRMTPSRTNICTAGRITPRAKILRK